MGNAGSAPAHPLSTPPAQVHAEIHPPHGQTNMTKNITFPQLRFRALR